MIRLIELENTPIVEQLKLEEALLRAHTGNYCIINHGAPPAIVMGISGKEELLIHPSAREQNIPIIRRFSGGGTVIVDEDTIFITFIFDADTHPFSPYPEPIYRWTESIYKDVFPEGFVLRENDYALHEKKFGGNAQYIRKNRWLHHSTLLFDFQKNHMTHLKHPQKTPKYRAGRSHDDFLTPLKTHYRSKNELIIAFKAALSKKFQLENTAYNPNFLTKDHRKSVSIL